MRVYFFDRFSEKLSDGPGGTGHELHHLPLPEEILYLFGTGYVVNSRSFHINTHGEHEVYLTLRGITEPKF